MPGENPTQARLIGGRYELEALIGRGGIGEVWRARHVALKSHVAVKFLQLAAAERKEALLRRFTTEAQVTAQLKTPNAVQVFDFGVTEEGQPYLVMELLEGETLGRRLERLHRLDPLATCQLLGQASRALQRAHQLGIVHRDFKPDNIVVSVDDEGRDHVKVLDFGVAKIIGVLEGEDAGDSGEERTSGPSFTRTGAVLGTPLYMAPEQVRNSADVGLRADIWAFGVVAFECLTGRAPFTGETIDDLFDHILSASHPAATFLRDDLPPAFDSWFATACATDPARRFPTAAVAWKQLSVALGMDDTLSLSGGQRDINAASGERAIVVADEHRAVGTAPTVDAEADAPASLLRRSQHPEFQTLRRIQKKDDHPRASPGVVEPSTPASPLSHTIDREGRRRRSPVVAPLAGVLIVIAALALWRTVSPTRSSAPPSMPSTPIAAQPSLPVTAPATQAAPSVAEAAPSAAPSSSSLAATPSEVSSTSRRPPRAAPGNRAGATTAAESPAVTGVSSPAPGPVPANPPPASAAVDPGSYR